MTDDGFAIVPGVLNSVECEALREAVAGALAEQQKKSANLRNLLRDVPLVASVARAPKLTALAGAFLRTTAFPVRALLFDKTPDANWSVSWHQDLAIPVKLRVDTPGFTGWSIKAGVPHVHPPASVLEQMIAVRLHLDDCDAANGALLVLPGSHREGKLDDAAVARWKTRIPPVTCTVARGGALLIRPLLLHASNPAATPRNRRVIHIEYASCALPGGLEWWDWNPA